MDMLKLIRFILENRKQYCFVEYSTSAIVSEIQLCVQQKTMVIAVDKSGTICGLLMGVRDVIDTEAVRITHIISTAKHVTAHLIKQFYAANPWIKRATAYRRKARKEVTYNTKLLRYV